MVSSHAFTGLLPENKTLRCGTWEPPPHLQGSCAQGPRSPDRHCRRRRGWPIYGGMTGTDDDPQSGAKAPSPPPKKPLTPAAERALAEAAERRAKQQAGQPAAKEIGGPSGPEPTRYGDWEKKGLTSDF